VSDGWEFKRGEEGSGGVTIKNQPTMEGVMHAQ